MVGLDIGDNHLAAAQLAFGRDNSIHLEAAGWATPPPEATPAQQAEAIRQLFRKAGLSNEAVCVAIEGAGLVLKHYRHANLCAEELALALSIEAEEALQLPSAQFYMDWHSNNEYTSGGPVDGVLVATPKAELDRHLQILALAEIYPRIVDVGALAVCNLFHLFKGATTAEQATAIICFSQNQVTIAILSGRHQVFPRTFSSMHSTWEESESYLADSLSDTIKYHQFVLHGAPVTRMLLTGIVPQHGQWLMRLRTLVPSTILWDPIPEVPSINKHLMPLLDSTIGARLAVSLGLALRRDTA